MGDFKMGSKTVLSQSGTNDPTWGANAPAGMVIEEFMSPCDGSSITVQSGTYTVGTVSATQDLTTSFADITGSSIDYTPPTGTQTVVYTFNCQAMYTDNHAIIHFKLFLDNDSGTATDVSSFRSTFEGDSVPGSRLTFIWAFHIGGSYTASSGRVATWTSARTIKMQAREHGSNHDSRLHYTDNFPGGGVITLPVIGIKALA